MSKTDGNEGSRAHTCACHEPAERHHECKSHGIGANTTCNGTGDLWGKSVPSDTDSLPYGASAFFCSFSSLSLAAPSLSSLAWRRGFLECMFGTAKLENVTNTPPTYTNWGLPPMSPGCSRNGWRPRLWRKTRGDHQRCAEG